MLLKIDEARYLGNYQFHVRFNDGRSGTVNVRPLIDTGPGSVFAVLADENIVKQFTLKYGTLCWSGKLDVAPEYLYFLAFQDDPALQEQFVAWGYVEQPART